MGSYACLIDKMFFLFLFAVLQLLHKKEFYGQKVDFVAPNLSKFFKDEVWRNNLILKLEEKFRCSIQIIQVPS